MPPDADSLMPGLDYFSARGGKNSLGTRLDPGVVLPYKKIVCADHIIMHSLFGHSREILVSSPDPPRHAPSEN